MYEALLEKRRGLFGLFKETVSLGLITSENSTFRMTNRDGFEESVTAAVGKDLSISMLRGPLEVRTAWDLRRLEPSIVIPLSIGIRSRVVLSSNKIYVESYNSDFRLIFRRTSPKSS